MATKPKASAALRRALGHDEHTQQVRLMDWLALQRGRWPWVDLVYAVPNFFGKAGKGGASAGVYARANREGRKKGVADLVFPIARGGWHGLYLEMKAKDDGQLSPEQKRFLAGVHREGYCAVACWGEEAARAVIEWYDGLGVLPENSWEARERVLQTLWLDPAVQWAGSNPKWGVAPLNGERPPVSRRGGRASMPLGLQVPSSVRDPAGDAGAGARATTRRT